MIGLQLYTVRDLLKTNFEQTIKTIASIGYDGIEVIPLNISYKEIARLSKNYSLKISSLFADYSNTTFKDLDSLGCNVLISSKTQDYFSSIERIKKTCDELNKTHKLLKSKGISFGIHNHWWEFEEINEVPIFTYLVNYLHPGIFFEIDLYWACVAGYTISKINNMSQVKFLHLKDGPLTKTDSMVAVGQGSMDFSGIKYAEWNIVELDTCSTDIIQAITDSFKFVKNNLNKNTFTN